MKAKVRRTLLMIGFACALYTLAGILGTRVSTTFSNVLKGASGGIALAGVFGIILIFAEAWKGEK
ncbi:MAG: hypothetical protein V4592_19105 [Bacteroidota bacterium]